MLLMAALVAASAVAAEKTVKIRRLGNPITSFSSEPATSMTVLQTQFLKYHSDLETVLREAGWEGDPRDLFKAVEDGKATRVALPVGERLEWMAYRKNGKPVTGSNLEWAGKEPMDAWKVEVESGGAVHTFVVPVACLNLAWHSKGPAYSAPTCSLSASVAGAGDVACGQLAAVTLSGQTDGSMSVTKSSGPGSGQPSSSGSGTWTYAPTAPGSYSFTATTTNEHDKSATCTASATVPAAVSCVECRLAASYDETSHTFTVDAGGSVGTVDVTGVTLPDGTAGNLLALKAAGTNRWTWAPEIPKKRGDYTYTFAARAEAEGATKDCNASVTIPGKKGPARDGGGTAGTAAGLWIARGFGVKLDGDDSVFQSSFLPDGRNLRDHASLEGGTGIGFSLERLLTDRMGLEFGVMFADLEARLMRDIDEAWETAEADIDVMPITLGLNFHLTPSKRFDLFIGPMVALVQLDDVSLRVLGDTVRGQSEDEFTWGARLGIDVPFSSTGDGWGLTAGVGYLDLSADFGDEGDNEDDEVEFAIDPLIFNLGLSYRF